MAYTKKTWANGDAITPTNLNNMEDGIADIHSRIQSGVAAFGAITSGQTLSKTITFPTAFSNAPQIVATPITSVPSAFEVSVAGASTVGCTIYVYSNSAFGNFNITWIAVQP